MVTRLKRYLMYGLQYFLREKPRGLDFTMRDTSLIKKSDGVCHGYSKTDENHLREIFDSLSFTSGECLLDIGCGKGVVLWIASDYPFEKVAGIEIDKQLIDIAEKNFQILSLEDKVHCIWVDAAEFEGYGDYDTFFLFNPFSDVIMKKVVDKLWEISERNPITVIYHNPVYMELFEQKGKVTIVKRLYDKRKDYRTYIFLMTGKGK